MAVIRTPLWCTCKEHNYRRNKQKNWKELYDLYYQHYLHYLHLYQQLLKSRILLICLYLFCLIVLYVYRCGLNHYSINSQKYHSFNGSSYSLVINSSELEDCNCNCNSN